MTISLRTLGLLVISAVVMAGATFGTASLVAQRSPAATLAPGVSPEDQGAGFGLQPDPSQPVKTLGPPPEKSVIQLVSFNKDQQPDSTDRAPWWTSSSPPRIPPITQFDGGPLQGVNCVMASGAMLARLGYGIVTTGTQMRTLQFDKSGGTNLFDMDTAVFRGWGVHFARGWLSSLQFRALLWAGAGAVILVNYGRIPVDLRNQKNFTGGHAMYADAFTPNGPNGMGPAYYIIDPIGRPWRGYDGDWWPANIVDDAAYDFGGGRYVTAWAFAGGTVARGSSPALPADGYPHKGGEKPPVNPSPEPVPTPAPSPPDASAGDDQPSIPPDAGTVTGTDGKYGGVSLGSILAVCATASPPSFCPNGVIGIYPLTGVPPPTPPPLVGNVPIDLLYASTPQPGVQQVIFTAPPGFQPMGSFWLPGGQVQQANLQPAVMDGSPVWIATFPVQTGTYDFVVSGLGAGVAGVSPVATLTVGGG